MIIKKFDVQDNKIIVHITDKQKTEIQSWQQEQKIVTVKIEAQDGTIQQNNVFHALLRIYFNSGLHSYDLKSAYKAPFEIFKDHIKKELGAGVKYYIYENDDNTLFTTTNKTEAATKCLHGEILKSWSEYSKRERSNTIANLITTMIEAGINTQEFQTICLEIGV